MKKLDCVENMRVGMLEHMHRNFKLCAKHFEASKSKKYVRVVPSYQALEGSAV